MVKIIYEMNSRTLIYLISILFLLGGVSCSKNEFKVEFDIAPTVTANYDVTYYASAKSGGVTIRTVAAVMQGKCELKGVTRLPTLLFLMSRKSPLPLVAYAEKGSVIKVAGESDDPWLWDVTGNSINKSLSEWRMAEADSIDGGKPQAVNRAVRRYIETNPDNPASAILLLCYFNRRIDENGYIQLWDMLQGDALDAKWIDLVARADQMEAEPKMPEKLISLSLRTINGVANVKSDSARASILYFFEPNTNDRKKDLDSLKLISKEYPDSSSRHIVYVCVDADSLSWRNTIRRDSLSGILSLWTPQGLADTQLMQLGVTRAPMVIVTDSLGEQHYHGDEMGEALILFRNLMDTVATSKR